MNPRGKFKFNSGTPGTPSEPTKRADDDSAKKAAANKVVSFERRRVPRKKK